MADEHPNIVVQPQGVVGVASEAVGALSNTPLLLVMVVLNVAFLFVAAYYLRTQQENTARLIDKIFDHCLPESHKP